MLNPQSLLDLPMEQNDAEAATIRDYLVSLLSLVWEDGEGFDGKRPFGNSGWDGDLLDTLTNAGITTEEEEDDRGRQLIAAAILSLGWVQSMVVDES